MSQKEKRKRRFARAILLGCCLVLTFAGIQSKALSQEQEADSSSSKKPQAWEYWAYEVKTWVVTDGSFEARNALPQIMERVGTLAHIADSSSWNIQVEEAPAEWNWRMMRYLDQPEDNLSYVSEAMIKKREAAIDSARKKKAREQSIKVEELTDPRPASITPLEQSFKDLVEQVEGEQFDKLMILRVVFENGKYRVSAREYDLRTRKWGAITSLENGIAYRVGELAYRALANAFMPITRLEKVYDFQNLTTRKTERWARARIRAVGVAKTCERNADGVLEMVDNVSSPVWVRSQDILLPVVRRTTREKTFESTTTVGWTFLVIQGQEGSKLECRTQSKDRVPLSGRTGTRIEKLALVIRPPNRSTRISMFAKSYYGDGRAPDPLADYEVFSRAHDDPPEVDSEMIGKTNFFGQIDVPPSNDGLRLLFIKSGYRGLAKLPVVPGLEDELRIELPNDEDRLYAEGVVRGLQNEVKDLLAQRQVLIARIERLLDKSQVKEADALYNFYRTLNTAVAMKDKINREKSRLASKDETQLAKINDMFDKLVDMVDKFITPKEETRILQKINEAKAADLGG